MKIALTGGGSAGHVTPNISIIEHLLDEGHTCLYIGSHKGIERKMIQDYFQSMSYFPISSGKLRRYFSFQNFLDIFLVFTGFFQSIAILKKQKPDLLFSKGGFIAPPVVYAAKLLNIPVFIHESDSSPGLATKLTYKFANKVFISDPKANQFFQSKNKKTYLVDLPIRKFLKIPKQLDPASKTLLIMGGSLGAKTLNDFLLNNFKEITSKFKVIHLTGKGHASAMPTNSPNYQKYEFVNQEIAEIYAKTDIVLCRSGATTLQEIKQLKIPAILVPLPTSQSRGEQEVNAIEYSKKYPATVILDKDLNFPNFQKAIQDIDNKEFPNSETKNSILDHFDLPR